MSKVIDSTNLDHLWGLIKQYADGAVAAISSKLVPSGGTAGQVLAKASATDHDLTWITPSSGPGGGVTGVKGDAETAYRTGNVSLSPDDIGAVSIHDTSTMEEGDSFSFGSDLATSTTSRGLQLVGTVRNSTQALDGHKLSFHIQQGFLSTYDHTAGSELFSTAMYSGTPTKGSGASSYTAVLNKQINIVVLRVNQLRLASVLSGGSNSGTLMTLPVGYRPTGHGVIVPFASTTAATGYVQITTAGVVNIHNSTSSSIATSASLYFEAVFFTS